MLALWRSLPEASPLREACERERHRALGCTAFVRVVAGELLVAHSTVVTHTHPFGIVPVLNHVNHDAAARDGPSAAETVTFRHTAQLHAMDARRPIEEGEELLTNYDPERRRSPLSFYM